MKHTLLGTTALVAASVIATGASAQSLEERIRTLEESMLMGAPGSGLDITVSGYIHGGFFLQDIDPDTILGTGDRERDRRSGQDYGSTDVKMGDAEAHFTATTILDNGIELAAHIELEGFTQADKSDGSPGDQIDETYIRAQGGFGRVVLGADDDAWNVMHYSSPNPGLNGVDSPNYRHAVGTGARTGTNASLTGDANKITYFTPRFSGFQFGISYTPDAVNTNGHAGSAPYDRNSGGTENVVGVAGNFSRTFGNVAVGASAGWQSGSSNDKYLSVLDNPSTTDTDETTMSGIKTDPAQWHIGGTVSRGGFTVGGAYANYEGIGGLNKDTATGAPQTEGNPLLEVDLSDKLASTAWTVGATYNTGPWTVGVGYFQSEQDVGVTGTATDDEGDTVNVVSTRTGETSVVNVGGSYELAPGVTVAADVSFYEDDDGTNHANGTQEAVGAGIIMGINF